MPETPYPLIKEETRWLEPDARVLRFAVQVRAAGLRTVLDLGAGGGRHSVYLAGQGLRVISADRSAQALLSTRAWLHTAGAGADFVQAEAGALPFADGSLEAIVSVFVIHHNLLQGIRRTVQEIRRVLRPGGLALLDVNSTATWRYRHEESAEVEPGTFVPSQGNEAGLPHRYFNEAEARDLFSVFQVRELYLNEVDMLHRDGVVRHHGQWTALVSR